MWGAARQLARHGAAIAAATLALVACSGDDATPQARAGPDPRFASPAALITYFNEINAAEPPDIRAELAMYYAENDRQRRILRAMRMAIQQSDLQVVSERRLGEAFTPLGPIDPEVARLETQDGQRATAGAVGETGNRRTLHLIEHDGRWWLSGYTYEYDAQVTDEWLRVAENAAEVYDEVVPALLRRINDGEFATIDELRDAFQEALIDSVVRRAGGDGGT